jgi:hypothetical protein
MLGTGRWEQRGGTRGSRIVAIAPVKPDKVPLVAG